MYTAAIDTCLLKATSLTWSCGPGIWLITAKSCSWKRLTHLQAARDLLTLIWHWMTFRVCSMWPMMSYQLTLVYSESQFNSVHFTNWFGFAKKSDRLILLQVVGVCRQSLPAATVCWFSYLSSQPYGVKCFFNRGSAEPKGSASDIQGFCWTAGAQEKIKLHPTFAAIRCIFL